MANVIYNAFLADLFNKEIDLEGDTIYCALLTSTYSADKDHTAWSDVEAYQAAGSGYTSGGQALASKAVTNDTSNDLAKFDSADPAWTSTTITARFAVLWDASRANRLIALFDFGTDKSSTVGTFTVQVSSDGWFTAAQSA